MNQCLENDSNVLHFMGNFVAAWTGSSVEYEIQKSYEDIFSKEKVLDAINHCVAEKVFFALPIEVQRKSAAFYLKNSGKVNYHGNVSMADADLQIEKWKNL